MSKKKQVFFLGAGFSRAIDSDYPLLSNLSNEIRDELNKGTDSISEHYKKEIPENIKDNVEHLLTYLGTSFPWKQEEHYIHKALYERITGTIQKRFIELAEKEYEDVKTEYEELIKYILKNHCIIISLNYDLLIEQIVKMCYEKAHKTKYFLQQEPYYYPLSWIGNRISNGGNWFAGDDLLRPHLGLIKLHGSANWYWAGTSPSDIIYYRNFNPNEKNVMMLGLKPYIIPPVMDKNAFYNHTAIQHLWKKAHHLLSEADEVFIIGFSFPQTDTSVRFLFQTALNPKTKVYIVDIAEKTDLERNHMGLFHKGQVDYSCCGNINPSPLEYFIQEKLLKKSEVSK